MPEMDVMHCYLCDAVGELVREERGLELGRRKVSLEQEFYRCPECGEEWVTARQMDETGRAASRLIREREGLLQAEEVRSIRERLGVSQADFEKLLGVGPKTVVRWERGTVFQNKSTDALLRLIANVPGVAEHLAARHGVRVSTSESDAFAYAAAMTVSPGWSGHMHTASSQPMPAATAFGRLMASDLAVGQPIVVDLETAGRTLALVNA